MLTTISQTDLDNNSKENLGQVEISTALYGIEPPDGIRLGRKKLKKSRKKTQNS